MTATLEHLTLKATITAAATGAFSAVVSTASPDRDGDVVLPAALVSALHAWVPTGKQVPLAYGHQYDADSIIGTVDPGSAHEVNNEVIVSGRIDLDSPMGKSTYRVAQSGSLGFSYGFLTTASTPRAGGGKNILALDVFEISATPIPANADTRILTLKSLATDTLDDQLAALERHAAAHGHGKALHSDIPDNAIEWLRYFEA